MESRRFNLLAAVLVALAGSAAAKTKDTTVTNKVRVVKWSVACTSADSRSPIGSLASPHWCDQQVIPLDRKR